MMSWIAITVSILVILFVSIFLPLVIGAQGNTLASAIGTLFSGLSLLVTYLIFERAKRIENYIHRPRIKVIPNFQGSADRTTDDYHWVGHFVIENIGTQPCEIAEVNMDYLLPGKGTEWVREKVMGGFFLRVDGTMPTGNLGVKCKQHESDVLEIMARVKYRDFINGRIMTYFQEIKKPGDQQWCRPNKLYWFHYE